MDRIVYNNLDFTTVFNYTERSKKKYIALILSELELTIKDEETYKLARKIVLDHVNELTRTWLRTIFTGGVEGMGIY